jgi:hypothetical protein
MSVEDEFAKSGSSWPNWADSRPARNPPYSGVPICIDVIAASVTDNPESKACKECGVAHVGHPNWHSKGLPLHAQLIARIQVQVVQHQPSMHTIGGLCSDMRKIFHLPSEEDMMVTNQLSSLHTHLELWFDSDSIV